MKKLAIRMVVSYLAGAIAASVCWGFFFDNYNLYAGHGGFPGSAFLSLLLGTLLIPVALVVALIAGNQTPAGVMTQAGISLLLFVGFFGICYFALKKGQWEKRSGAEMSGSDNKAGAGR